MGGREEAREHGCRGGAGQEESLTNLSEAACREEKLAGGVGEVQMGQVLKARQSAPSTRCMRLSQGECRFR